MRVLALLLLLALAGCARPVPPGVTELTYATPYPASHPFSRADQRWIAYVEKASGGTLRIRPIWAGALLSSDMSLEELRHGVADVGLITPIYSRGGTHLLRIQTGFYSGADSIGSQVALYRCLEESVPGIDRELKGLHVLAVQGGLLPGILTRKKQVKSLADLKGIRIRAPTELLAVLRNLGADPVNMPMGDVYSAMARDVIDGVVAPVDTFRVLHFDEVGKYFYTLSIPRGAYPSRAIGDEAWRRLSPEQKRVLEAATPVWEAALTEEIEAGARAGLVAAKSAKVVFTPATPDQQARFDALYLQDAAANARALRNFGIDGTSAFTAARAVVHGRDRISCGALS
jgi:TRAP-type C4-dicarboxylate transport system substrate-binding protein